MYRKSLCAVNDVYISVTEHNWKLKFSMQTHLPQINTVFEYCHASMNLDHVDILDYEMGMYIERRPALKKKMNRNYVFSQKTFLV